MRSIRLFHPVAFIAIFLRAELWWFEYDQLHQAAFVFIPGRLGDTLERWTPDLKIRRSSVNSCFPRPAAAQCRQR